MENLKKNIHAVLQSAKDGVHVLDFKREYCHLTGEDIIFRKYGYRSLEDLMSHIPDTVERIYFRGNEVYRAVSNERTEHLQRLIEKQKSAPARRSKPIPSRRRPLHANENLQNSNRRYNGSRYDDFHRKPKYEMDHTKQFQNFRVTVDSCCGGQRTTNRGNVKRSVEMKDTDTNSNRLEPKSISLSVSKNNRMFQKAMKEAISSNEQLSNDSLTRFHVPPGFQKQKIKTLGSDSGKGKNKLSSRSLKVQTKEHLCFGTTVQDGDKYMSCLLDFSVKKSLPVAFQTLSVENGFESSIQVKDQVYISSGYFRSELEAEQSAAKNACTTLDLDPYDTENTLGIDEQSLKKQILEIVAENGIWIAKLGTEFKKRFAEDPPDNLEALVRSWTDIFKFEAPVGPDREIVYPLKSNGPYISFTGKEVKIEDAQLLEIGKEVEVYTTFIYSCAYFYVQPESTCIHEIEAEMNQDCQKYSVDIKALEKGGFCAAQYTADNNWSRASILAVDEEKSEVEVYYVDYGNTEKISIDRITKLPESVAKFPVQAVLCGLFGIMPPEDEATFEQSKQEFGSLVVQDKKLKATTILLDENKTCQVILFNLDCPKESINEILANEGVAYITHQSPDNPELEGDNEPEYEARSPSSPHPSTLDVERLRDGRFAGGAPLSLPGERFWDVYVSFLSSTVDVIIRLVGENYSDDLEKLESEIEKWFPDASEDPIREGAVCAAQVEGLFHRIKVLGLKGSRNKADCLFLDHGDSDELHLDQLRILDPKLNYLPYQAIPCVLAGLEQYSTDITAIEKLFDMALGKTCVAEAVTKDNKIYAVLYDTMGEEDVNINDEAAKCAASCGSDLISSLLQDGTETVSSSTLSQLSLTSTTTLETVLKQTDSKDSLTTSTFSVASLTPDSPAAFSVQNLTNGRTKYKSDTNAAKVLAASSNNPSGLSPLSCFTVHNDKSADEMITKAIAYCESGNPNAIEPSSSSSSVIASCDNGSSTLDKVWLKANYMKLKPPERFKVPSFPEISYVFIDSISDPSNFIIIPHHSLPVRDTMVAELSNQINAQPLPSMTLTKEDILFTHPFACQFEENWYRVVPTSVPENSGGVLVWYADYGGYNMVNFEDLQPLPKEFWELPYQAVPCKLHNIVPSDNEMWTEAAKYKFYEIACNKSFACLAKCSEAGDNLSVILIDTSGEEDVCVDDILLAYSYGKRDKQ